MKLAKISIQEFQSELPEFFKKLEDLTLGEGGYMKYHLQACRLFAHKNDFTADIFVICEEDIVGWALCQDLAYRNEDYKELSIFIDPKYRGKNYGGKLIEFIIENTDYRISCWGSEGEGRTEFFRKYVDDKLNLFDMEHYMRNNEFKLL